MLGFSVFLGNSRSKLMVNKPFLIPAFFTLTLSVKAKERVN